MGTLAALASWSGRILAVGLFAVWGAFFVEHLGWFLHPGQGLPPPRVWLLQLVHLAMLAGLLLLLRWEVMGGILTAAAALVFFASTAGPRFPMLFSATLLPAGLVLLGRWLRLRSASSHTVP